MAQRPQMIESETLPCGCVAGTAIVDGEPVFVFEPHAYDCEYYRYAIEESKRQGKPIELIMVD